VPAVARGLLGIVLCGLIAAQVSALTADVNSVATLFTSDVYRSFRKRELSQKHIVVVVRASSIICGSLMLLVAYLLYGNRAGAVRANLTVVGILDMPLFVITILYGLMWKRANWQGAMAGFVGGGILGMFTYFLVTQKFFDAYLQPVIAERHYVPHFIGAQLVAWHEALKPHEIAVRNIVPFISSGAALIITPIVSLLTARSTHSTAHIWDAFKVQDHGDDEDTFHVIPVSTAGRLGLAAVLGGFCVFACGIVSAHWAIPAASYLAIGGMLAVFAGGLVRVYSE